MAAKKANTPKPAKAVGKAAETATNSRPKVKHRKRVTRDKTKSRADVRRQSTMRQGGLPND
jgi:hypothetical protein